MNFIQSCFIQKCTLSLIEKLVGLGYKIVGKTTLCYGIFCNNGKIKICSTNEQPSIKDKDFIQCYDNEELFLALAALCDDSDYMQWFTDGEKWYQNRQNDIEVIRYGASGPINFHKATVEELIEHFKIKQL